MVGDDVVPDASETRKISVSVFRSQHLKLALDMCCKNLRNASSNGAFSTTTSYIFPSVAEVTMGDINREVVAPLVARNYNIDSKSLSPGGCGTSLFTIAFSWGIEDFQPKVLPSVCIPECIPSSVVVSVIGTGVQGYTFPSAGFVEGHHVTTCLSANLKASA